MAWGWENLKLQVADDCNRDNAILNTSDLHSQDIAVELPQYYKNGSAQIGTTFSLISVLWMPENMELYGFQTPKLIAYSSQVSSLKASRYPLEQK